MSIKKSYVMKKRAFINDLMIVYALMSKSFVMLLMIEVNILPTS